MAVREPKSRDQPSWPPVLHEDETEVDKKARLKTEAEAKRVSELIDRQIEQDRQEKERDPGGKILLLGVLSLADSNLTLIYFAILGQAESGKSTVLKNFQMYFAPKAFQSEVRILW